MSYTEIKDVRPASISTTTEWMVFPYPIASGNLYLAVDGFEVKHRQVIHHQAVGYDWYSYVARSLDKKCTIG